MLRTRTMVGSGCLLAILLTTGFIVMLRSCLSSHDERAAILPAVIVKNDSVAVIFAIISYDKTSSYSSGGGYTRKTVNTSYYLQVNDIESGAKLRQVKVKPHNEIHQWPVKILGVSGKTVWAFIGELLAFDGINLNVVCTIGDLEKKNPFLAGKFPSELKYYNFDPENSDVIFTATDGNKWRISTTSFLITPQPASNFADRNGKHLSNKLQQSLLNQGTRINSGYTQMGMNVDTFAQQWFGMYSADEFASLPPRIYVRRANDETARRLMIKSKVITDKNQISLIDSTVPVQISANTYLDGAFLLDRITARPARLNNDFLVIYKSKIGNEGVIQVSRISPAGKEIWKGNTGLVTWQDWMLFDDKLVIFASDNRELMGDECNVLLILDTNTGGIRRYDYFDDRSTTAAQ